MVHNAQMTTVLPSPEEMRRSAQAMVERLNQALGPTLVVIPEQGFSDPNQKGRELWGPEGNRVMIETLEGLRPEVPVIRIDAHLNDPEFADVVTDCMERLLAGESPQAVAARFET